MYNLTIQEKGILLFILSTFILGLAVMHVKKVVLRNATDSVISVSSDVAWAKEEIKKAKSININTASVSEITQLPGIGNVIAKRIIEYRTANGPFLLKSDILNVKGIGQKKFEAIKAFILLE